MACRFIQHENRRVQQNRARDSNSLSLSARQRQTALADDRFISVREAMNEFVDTRGPGCSAGFKPGCGRATEADVIRDSRIQ